MRRNQDKMEWRFRWLKATYWHWHTRRDVPSDLMCSQTKRVQQYCLKVEKREFEKEYQVKFWSFWVVELFTNWKYGLCKRPLPSMFANPVHICGGAREVIGRVVGPAVLARDSGIVGFTAAKKNLKFAVHQQFFQHQEDNWSLINTRLTYHEH